MMKRYLYILNFLILLLMGCNLGFGQTSASGKTKRWKTLYNTFSPQQEELSKRTRISKTFRNVDGSYSALFTGITHYKDDKGEWQDVDYSISQNTSSNSNSHKYANTTAEIKTYFPEKPGGNGVVMDYFGNEISFWNNPKMQLTAGGSIFYKENAKENSALLTENKLTYPGVYQGMNEEVMVLEDGQGIEDNIIINNINPALTQFGNNTDLEFYQFIPIGSDWKIYNGDKETTSDFSSEIFSIKKEGFEQGFVFNPIIVFDNSIQNKDQASRLISTPKDKLRSEEIDLIQHIANGSYKVVFVNGGIEVYGIVPFKWFNAQNRVFPITIDPTVTIGSAASAFNGALWDGYDTDVRNQNLFLATDFTGAGMLNGDIITAIGVDCSTNGCSNTHTGLKIRMQSTASATFASLNYTNAGYTDCYSGSQNVNATGWYTHTFTSNFTFNSAQNVIIDFTMNMGTYLCGASHNAFWYWNTGVNRTLTNAWASDIGDPQTQAVANAYNQNVEYMQVTYTRNPGSSYGIYGAAAQTSATITDCQISATAGGGSATACKVCTPADIGYVSVAISGYPVISSGDATNNYTNCTGANMNMTKVVVGATTDWTGSSAPLTGSGNPKTVNYTAASLGRKTVVMNNGTGYTYTGFNNMLLDAPSKGTTTCSVTGICPGTATFTSSLGSTPGFSFSWAVPAPPAGITVTSNSAPTASSTDITFANTNTTGTGSVVTVVLTVTSKCCGVLGTINQTITIYPVPAAPGGSGGGSICPGGSTTLTASSGLAGANFEWYDASSGGTLLNTGATYTVSPVANTDYWVQVVNPYGCTSTARTQVTVTITATPAPAINAVAALCGPSPVTLTVTAPVANYVYTWYAGSCGSTVLQSSTSTTYIATVSSTTTYYLSAIAPGGCNASLCGSTTVTIGAPPGSMTWNGTTSADPAGCAGCGSWFNSSNWNNTSTGLAAGCIPNCNVDVIIPVVGSVIYPTIGFNAGGAASAHTLNLNTGGTPPSITFIDAKAELDICGDFVQNGAITSTGTGNLSTIVFMGSTTQNFTRSSTGSGDLFNVILANTATPPLLKIKEASTGTNMDMNIASSFTFQSGIVHTEGARKLTILNSAPSSLSGGTVNGYVWGRLNRKIATGNAYDFPVGENPVTATAPFYPYELLNINFTSVTGLNDLTVKFENPSTNAINTIASSTTSPGLSLNGGAEGTYTPLIDCGGANTGVGVAGMGGVWTVLPNAGTANYSLALYGTNFDNAGAGPTSWSILKRSTYSDCATSPSWGLDGVYSTNAISGNLVSASRTGMSGFSQFAIARTTVSLPIELIAFDVTCTKNDAKISWATSSEKNNNHFTLERSCDNMNSFITIATIPGAGNSISLNQYSFSDTDYNGAVCYYRLSQTDNDGTTVYFNTIAASCELNSTFTLNSVLPNPTNNNLSVLFTNNVNENVFITVTDMLGQEFYNKEILCEKGLNTITLDMSNYSEGVYFLKVNNGKKSFIKKVIKN